MATATRYRSGEEWRQRQGIGAARGGDSDKLQERRGVATATRYRSGEGWRQRQVRSGEGWRQRQAIGAGGVATATS